MSLSITTSACNTFSAALTCIFPFTHFTGCQQHPGAEGRERHPFQPSVPSAIAVQLAQVAAQVAAELPAARLGDAHRPQRSALLHRPQQQKHDLGESSKEQKAGTELLQ